MVKSNIRSFRYSDKVAEILNNFGGNSLNEKFENLVLFCFDKIPETEKQLNDIEKQIRYKRNEYMTLSNQMKDVSDLIYMLDNLKRQGEAAAKRAEQIANSKTRERFGEGNSFSYCLTTVGKGRGE